MLTNGAKVPMDYFVNHRADVRAFVVAGNVLFLTVNGSVRMALVPAEDGARVLRTKVPTAPRLGFVDGGRVPLKDYLARRADAEAFVSLGGMLILTVQGHERMALVPEASGRAILDGARARMDERGAVEALQTAVALHFEPEVAEALVTDDAGVRAAAHVLAAALDRRDAVSAAVAALARDTDAETRAELARGARVASEWLLQACRAVASAAGAGPARSA